jgi:hypothetical protein
VYVLITRCYQCLKYVGVNGSPASRPTNVGFYGCRAQHKCNVASRALARGVGSFRPIITYMKGRGRFTTEGVRGNCLRMPKEGGSSQEGDKYDICPRAPETLHGAVTDSQKVLSGAHYNMQWLEYRFFWAWYRNAMVGP